MGSKANHLAQAKKLRARSEECRRLCTIVPDEHTKAAYLELADNYEALAQEEEELAEVYKQQSG